MSVERDTVHTIFSVCFYEINYEPSNSGRVPGVRWHHTQKLLTLDLCTNAIKVRKFLYTLVALHNGERGRLRSVGVGSQMNRVFFVFVNNSI